MFYKLDENEAEYMERVGQITDVDYEIKDNCILIDNLLLAIKDLVYEYDVLQEKFEDYKNREEDYFNPDEEIPNIHYDNMMAEFNR